MSEPPDMGRTPPPDSLDPADRIAWVKAVEKARSWGMGCGFTLALGIVFVVVVLLWSIQHVAFH